MMRSQNKPTCTSSCGCAALILLLNVLLGTITFNYCLLHIVGKTVPFAVAFVGGLFAGEITMPLAIIIWILRLCGVHTPIF